MYSDLAVVFASRTWRNAFLDAGSPQLREDRSQEASADSASTTRRIDDEVVQVGRIADGDDGGDGDKRALFAPGGEERGLHAGEDGAMAERVVFACAIPVEESLEPFAG